jgi:transcriptional regulator with XRE-family HTH domain
MSVPTKAKRYEELTPEQRAKVDAFRARRDTPEHRAEEEAIRRRFAHRPSLARLVAEGEILGPSPIFAELKAARERRGLSLTDVAEASGLERAMVSRLENGKIHNPTLETLDRYARAVGLRVAMRLVEPETSGQRDVRAGMPEGPAVAPGLSPGSASTASSSVNPAERVRIS